MCRPQPSTGSWHSFPALPCLAFALYHPVSRCSSLPWTDTYSHLPPWAPCHDLPHLTSPCTDSPPPPSSVPRGPSPCPRPRQASRARATHGASRHSLTTITITRKISISPESFTAPPAAEGRGGCCYCCCHRHYCVHVALSFCFVVVAVLIVGAAAAASCAATSCSQARAAGPWTSRPARWSRPARPPRADPGRPFLPRDFPFSAPGLQKSPFLRPTGLLTRPFSHAAAATRTLSSRRGGRGTERRRRRRPRQHGDAITILDKTRHKTLPRGPRGAAPRPGFL